MTHVTLNATASGLTDKVQAIKGVRALSKCGLKEAKRVVEDVADHNWPQTIQIHPSMALGYPEFILSMEQIRDGGLSATVVASDDPVRNAMAEQIQGLAVWATMAAQYDLAQALNGVMESHCPGLPKKKEDNNNNEYQTQK